ncbi:hypothetical protein AX15_002623 [Amanita polypyramis BW_CC]|nr:hypothetical protein AX15_002623 [Amanita polypyramis BW_CC]
MESSQSSASAAEREAQLLGVGKQCTHVQCMLVDFLPFRCHYCQKSFCQEHFKVEAHQCSQYDETKYNRIAPNCPMCNTPVAIKLGQDPNARMEEHFSTECTAMTGRGAAKSTPTCAKGNCKKVLYTPIKCDKCKKDFCASHRFPTDHNCSAASTAKTVTATRLGDTHPIVAKYMALSNARKGTTTAKRTTAGPGTSSKASTSKTSTTLSVPSPFNKTDRRARDERMSRVKAMQERAKKGLLSDREKEILAAEEAELKNNKDECTVM